MKLNKTILITITMIIMMSFLVNAVAEGEPGFEPCKSITECTGDYPRCSGETTVFKCVPILDDIECPQVKQVFEICPGVIVKLGGM